MLTAAEIQKIAQEMQAAQIEGRQIRPFTSRIRGFDLTSAYAVARNIHEARVSQGSVPVGRKIGFTNPAMWSAYGVREPIWAYIYNNTVTHLAKDHTICTIHQFAEPKIEPEIIFHFHSEPPVGATPSAILKTIDWVAHGYEIVQSHFPGWKFQAADTVADQSLHATLLVGQPVPIEQIAADPIATLKSFSLELSRDGAVCGVGNGANVLGSPLNALAHLIKVLSSQPGRVSLQADEIVTTGTITAALPVRVGETWQTALQGIALPGLTVEFVH